MKTRRAIFSLFLFLITTILCVIQSRADTPVWKVSYTLHGRGAIAATFIDIDTLIVVGGNIGLNSATNAVIKYKDRGETLINYNDFNDIHEWFKGLSFPSHDTGYAIGWNGQYLKTVDAGASWNRIALPSSVQHRNYNDIFFVNNSEGYAVGGNDSVETIIKTTDGGLNWTVLHDSSGSWLQSVYFTSNTTGFCTGLNGTILKTTNSGATWIPVAVSGSGAMRDFNKITFINSNTGYIVGGKDVAPRIQTILKTTNGGNNWSTMIDTIGAPMLHNVDFISPDVGYTVGNNGTFKMTENGGLSWTNVLVPDSIYDTLFNVWALDFFNDKGGMIGDEIGRLILFERALPVRPTVVTGTATAYTNNKMRLTGSVNAHNSATHVYFEYGTTRAMQNFIPITDSIYDSAVHSFNVITPVLAPGIYYYRIHAVNAGGFDTGTVMRIYVGPNPIPNFDFEFWRQDTLLSINQGWLSSGNVKVGVSYNGSHSLIIRSDTMVQSDRIGVILLGLVDKGNITGGAAFNVKPDSIAFFSRYDFKPGFPGTVLMLFRLNTVVIDTIRIEINGSSNGQFVRLSYPIVWQNPATPDSLVIGFVNNRPFDNTPIAVNDSNYFEIDDISFPGTAVNVPNHDFEDLGQDFQDIPVSWFVSRYDSVFKTTFAQSGQYAVKIKSNGLSDGYINTYNDYYQGPSFPFTVRFDSMFGYLKYEPVGDDTAFVSLNIYKNHEIIGGAQYFHAGADTGYVPFKMSCSYNNSNDIPDSANIYVFASTRRNLSNGSIVYVDNLNFGEAALDSLLLGSHQHTIVSPDAHIRLFPNPTNGLLNVEVNAHSKMRAAIHVFGVDGSLEYSDKALFEKGITVWQEDFSALPKGIYILRLSDDEGRIFISRWIKE